VAAALNYTVYQLNSHIHRSLQSQTRDAICHLQLPNIITDIINVIIVGVVNTTRIFVVDFCLHIFSFVKLISVFVFTNALQKNVQIYYKKFKDGVEWHFFLAGIVKKTIEQKQCQKQFSCKSKNNHLIV